MPETNPMDLLKPGCWFVDGDPEDEDCLSVYYGEQGAESKSSAEIAGRICVPAYARLIAAAPDLLEAAHLMRRACTAGLPHHLVKAFNALGAAITKTEEGENA